MTTAAPPPKPEWAAAPLARHGPVRLDASARPQRLRRPAALLVHRRRRQRRQCHEQYAARADRAVYGGAVARTPIRHAPLFIVGHWRTGTTLLHELLILDPRHAFPTTYQCMEPNHFLLTERLVPALVLVPDAVAPADGQHGGRLGPAAGGRVRPVHARGAVAVPDHRLPQPPAAGPGSARPRTAVAARLAGWKRAFLRFLAA